LRLLREAGVEQRASWKSVEDVFEDVKWAEEKEKEEACKSVREWWGPEAEAELRALFICPETQPRVDEEDGTEDSENAANNVRRKLWRLESALAWLGSEFRPQVWCVLRRMSEGNEELGQAIWADWVGDHAEARRLWAEGYDVRARVNELYGVAQRAGWRYPVAQNLNRLDEMVQRVEGALVRVETDIYQSGGKLVRPVTVEVDATKGRKTRIARLVGIEGAWLRSELSRYVDFFKWDKKSDKPIRSAPPHEVVSAMLGRYGRWEFPTLSGVICAPTLRRDGSILAKEGFDRTTGLLVMSLPAMPTVNMAPGRAEAERAVRLLDGLLDEFPFVDRASRAVALSGMITPVVRPALSCVPMHAITAPQPGTGKSFLLDTVAAIANGDAMPVIAAGHNLEEMGKRLDAQVIEGISLLTIDNVSMPLGGDELCQVIERPTYAPRILGQSKMKERRNNWCLYADGNNLRLRDDVTRRCLLVQLDAGTERPELRQFRGNPFERVLADRGMYLWAALTVVKGYMAAGMPDRLPRIGDPFAEWSDLVRSALVWLGFEDPVLSMEAVRENDPSRQARMAMFQAMANAYGVGIENRRTASEMVKDAKEGTIVRGGKRASLLDMADEAENLKAALVGYTSDRLDAKHLGNKLNIDRRAIAGGLRLDTSYDSHNKVNQWFVETLQEGKS
jgi:hypothetical protein